MNQSIKAELTEYINDRISEGYDVNHYNLFNEDYYIIGYYQASEWLKKHNIDVFDGITYCQEQETDNFGESNTIFNNSEVLVNNIVYWYGYELCEQMNISTE